MAVRQVGVVVAIKNADLHMKKLSLTLIGCYIGILGAFAQNSDTSAYKPKKLTFEEANLVSGYYQQDGNHSAVTGGIGTEHLTDIATTFDVRFFRYDRKERKHSFTFELGVDHYSSASSDKIDPMTISSASSADNRIYPSIGWTAFNEQKQQTIGLNASLSREYDYFSKGLGASYSKTSKDENRELSLRAQVYLDQWKVILPVELRISGQEHEGREPRNSYSASFSLAQVVNRNLQVAITTEPTYQSGLLATRYQRVFFKNGGLATESLPDTRLKIPIGLRANYFAGDKLILRSFYRYYQDDWGVRAHTIDLEAPYKIGSFFSISPFYRYYRQTTADYFAPYGQHATGERNFTSDYDLSQFSSQFFGTGLRLSPPKGIISAHVNSLELRYGHYKRSNGLSSDQISLHLKFK